MEILEKIAHSIEQGNPQMVAELTTQAVQHPLPPKDILDNALIAGMNVVGEKYKHHEIFLPDVLMAAKAMYAGMDILKPLFLKTSMPTMGKVVIGTVYGDLHDIGKNLVGIMLKGAGFEIIDLGNNVAPSIRQ
jgi:5-methyltetrahydrofolate--homocysteine methyltransferase